MNDVRTTSGKRNVNRCKTNQIFIVLETFNLFLSFFLIRLTFPWPSHFFLTLVRVGGQKMMLVTPKKILLCAHGMHPSGRCKIAIGYMPIAYSNTYSIYSMWIFVQKVFWLSAQIIRLPLFIVCKQKNFGDIHSHCLHISMNLLYSPYIL